MSFIFQNNQGPLINVTLAFVEKILCSTWHPLIKQAWTPKVNQAAAQWKLSLYEEQEQPYPVVFQLINNSLSKTPFLSAIHCFNNVAMFWGQCEMFFFRPKPCLSITKSSSVASTYKFLPDQEAFLLLNFTVSLCMSLHLNKNMLMKLTLVCLYSQIYSFE